MNVPVEVIFDPHILNAIQAICISIIILTVVLFENIIDEKAKKQ